MQVRPPLLRGGAEASPRGPQPQQAPPCKRGEDPPNPLYIYIPRTGEGIYICSANFLVYTFPSTPGAFLVYPPPRGGLGGVGGLYIYMAAGEGYMSLDTRCSATPFPPPPGRGGGARGFYGSTCMVGADHSGILP